FCSARLEQSVRAALVRARVARQGLASTPLRSGADRRTARGAAVRVATSFVDAYAPHGPYVTLFACVHIDPCERNRRRRPRASASSEDAYVRAHRRTRVREDHSERQREPARKTGGRGGDLRSRRWPA